MQERSYKVERLLVYEENKQKVIFKPTDTVKELLKKLINIKLTQYFEVCAANQNDSLISILRYIDFPKHFIWKNRH